MAAESQSGGPVPVKGAAPDFRNGLKNLHQPLVAPGTRGGFPYASATALLMVRALRHLIDVSGGGTAEQQRVLRVLALHLLGVDAATFAGAVPLEPDDLAAQLPDPALRRRFVQLAIMVDLCRHPQTEAQLQRLDAYAAALDFDSVELAITRSFYHLSAAEATDHFVRTYAIYLPELSERFGTDQPHDPQVYDDAFFDAVANLHRQPRGSLGWCFTEFYARSGLKLPGRDTPNPGYYVCHDMNHVITGCEATGPGEIALGAFKLALCNTEANWMASLTNFMIHEVGMFTHGTDLQFVPSGAGVDPYDGKRGALDLPGAPELLAESLRRGAACSGDFSRLDHLAIAHVPLVEIRRQFNVPPMAHPMYDDAEFWPRA